jgi:hypothetical protein
MSFLVVRKEEKAAALIYLLEEGCTMLDIEKG